MKYMTTAIAMAVTQNEAPAAYNSGMLAFS
jgi:hypothetical protein